MRDNVDILEKYIENLEVKKNLLQTTIEAYKLDINEYLEFLKENTINADYMKRFLAIASKMF